MDSIKNKLDSSRIIVIVSVVYVIVITAIAMYLYMKFNEKERFDRRFINRLENHQNEKKSMYISTMGFYNPNTGVEDKKNIRPPLERGNTTEKCIVSLVNCHIKTAFNCCAVNTYRNSWVSLEALKYCLEIGMRCLDFEIYSVNSKPVVGLNSREKNIDMKESFNKLPLGDVINEIRRFREENSGTAGTVNKTPLILHFRIKTKQKEALRQFARDVTLIDKKNQYQTKYYDINKENITACFIHEPLETLDNKVIVIANFSSIKPSTDLEDANANYEKLISESGIENAVNLISPSKFCDYTTNTTVQLAETNGVNPNRLTLSAPFADFEGSCVPFNPKQVAKAGVQLIGICAQKNLQKNPNKMVDEYFQLFAAKGTDGDTYCSYIAKNAGSRNLYYTYTIG